jgi:putative thioredoxin
MDFEKDVILASQQHPVVVDFWAEWCGPCKTLGPVLEKVVAESKGSLSLVKIDVDQNPNLAQMFQVQGIPFVLIFKDGQPIDGFQGALPEDQLRQWLSQYMGQVPQEPDPTPEQIGINSLIAQGKTAEAIEALKEQIETEEDTKTKEESQLLLGQLLLSQDPDQAKAVFGAFHEDSDHYDTAHKLGMLANFLAVTQDVLEAPENLANYTLEAQVAFNKGDIETCLDQLLEVLYRNKNYQDDMARKAFIGIFEFLGRDHETVKAYSRRFEMAIF